jgi:hypothetical protein
VDEKDISSPMVSDSNPSGVDIVHSNQRFLARMIVDEHIRLIFNHFHRRKLEDFKDIDIQVSTLVKL